MVQSFFSPLVPVLEQNSAHRGHLWCGRGFSFGLSSRVVRDARMRETQGPDLNVIRSLQNPKSFKHSRRTESLSGRFSIAKHQRIQIGLQDSESAVVACDHLAARSHHIQDLLQKQPIKQTAQQSSKLCANRPVARSTACPSPCSGSATLPLSQSSTPSSRTLSACWRALARRLPVIKVKLVRRATSRHSLRSTPLGKLPPVRERRTPQGGR